VNARIEMGMSFGAYCDLKAVNASTYLHFADKTPEEAHYEITHPKEDTLSLVKGHATHAAILEPKVFDSLYCAEPDFGDLRTKAARASRDTWRVERENHATLPPKEYAKCIAMRDKVMADPYWKEFVVGKGQNEITVLWTDEETGLDCKARIDRLTVAHGYPTLLDIKTDCGVGDRGIERAIFKYHYHIRMAWYAHALSRVKPAEWRIVLLWILNEPPHTLRTTEFDEAWLKEGQNGFRACLNKYAECLKTGYYPGYPHGIDVVPMPIWAYRFSNPKGL